jgi:ribosomal protein S18 acetylase RimI-like enzyme
MVSEDREAVLQLGNACLPTAEYPYSLWTGSELDLHFARAPELCIVAVAGDRVVGFCTGDYEWQNNRDCAYIAWCFVEEHCRRHGVATALMRRLERLLLKKGRRAIVADTTPDNRGSQKMLTQLGYGKWVESVYYRKEL